MTVRLSSLGEKAYLERLLPRLYADPRLKGGYGNDSAIIDCGLESQHLILNIDRVPISPALVPGSDDDRVWGRLLVTACCSDILSSGGLPQAVMLSVAVPGDWPAERVDEIVFGCQEECRREGVVFSGGDTKEASSPQLVGSAVGLVSKLGALYRNGARPGHLVVIAGEVGGFMGAYFALTSRLAGYNCEKDRNQWLHHLTFPRARWREAALLRNNLGVIAGMDTSDGLYDTLVTLCQNQLGISLSLESMPYHPFAVSSANILDIPIINLAFGCGDWNIVFAMDEMAFEKVKEKATDRDCRLTAIGRFREEPGICAYDHKGSEYRVVAPINEHFKHRFEDAGSFMTRIRSCKILH